MGIKGESMIESVMINQGKTGAVNKTEVFVVVSFENRLGGLFNRSTDMQHSDSALVKRCHEFGRGVVADSEADQSVGFGENEVRR